MSWQPIAVDVVVAGAAAWLLWSFGPDSLRRWVRGRRRVAPGYDVALRADGLAGHVEDAKEPDACGPDCGCH